MHEPLHASNAMKLSPRLVLEDSTAALHRAIRQARPQVRRIFVETIPVE